MAPEARKWRQKSLDVFNSFSLEMMDWVIEEVTFKAETFLKKEMADVEPLENIAEHDKDYEPGPGEQIVNLVDPSLRGQGLGGEDDPFSVINNGRAGTKGVIPLWNMTLKPLRAERLHHRNRIKSSELNTCRVPTSNSLREILELGSLSDVEDIYDCLWEREKHRPVKSPETRPISLWLDRLRSEKPIDLQTTVRARGLQVIVKLADIKLTPETPRYIGTPWHFQWLLRRLLDWLHKNYFHKGFGLPWLPQVFGCNEEEKQTGDMGQVSCLEGPILPGHCKSLVLHLVDPYVHIISTANVPPQQAGRWDGLNIQRDVLARKGLPGELQDMVLD
ncbi:hypothetical protein KXW97_008207 [Aspergillus fumigatus]|nr:hypothetical protein KXW97_008207 [Aspergillus fumigatus]